MEVSPQQQSHEQKADENSAEIVFPKEASLAETSQRRVKAELLLVLGNIKNSRADKPRTEKDIQSALSQLERISLDLVGMGLKELERDTFDGRSVAELNKLLLEGADPGTIAESLAGIDTDDAWQMRYDLKGQVHYSDIAVSLAGIDSDRAWKLREELYEESKNKNILSIAASVMGLDSERAWQLRQELLDTQHYDKAIVLAVAKSLVGVDSDRSWGMRKDLSDKRDNPSHIMVSLAGLDSARAWETRRELAGKVDPSDTAYSLIGLDSSEAWALRDKFEDEDDPFHFLPCLSIAGLDSSRAWDVRIAHTNNTAIIYSLAGVCSERAWEMRDNLKKQDVGPRDIAKSISGEDVAAIAWRAAQGLLPYQQEQRVGA